MPAIDVWALGHRLVIDMSVITDTEVRRRTQRLWGFASADPPPGDDVTEPIHVKLRELEGPDAEDSLRAGVVGLTQSATFAAIERAAGRLLMLHGAALADPVSGKAVAVVAPGNTGKTTFALTLGAGRHYLTDETVGVDASGRIAPYAKPLSVRRPDGTGMKDERFPGDFGLLPPIDDAMLSGILLLVRDGSPTPRLEELGVLDAITALAPESSSLSKLPTPLRTLADLIERVGVRRVHYDDSASLEPIVQEVIGP